MSWHLLRLFRRPPHPDLPADAVVGHDVAVIQKVQAYWDQPSAQDPEHLEVKGYAVSPNPSADFRFFVKDAERIIYIWYVDKPYTLTIANAADFGA